MRRLDYAEAVIRPRNYGGDSAAAGAPASNFYSERVSMACETTLFAAVEPVLRARCRRRFRTPYMMVYRSPLRIWYEVDEQNYNLQSYDATEP